MSNVGPDCEVGLDEVQDGLLRFAYSGATVLPLYRRLAEVSGQCPEIATLLLAAPPLQRLPVLLLAAIHLLLLEGADDDLRAWYPNLVADPRRVDGQDPAAALIRFCRAHHEELHRILTRHQVQTNEVGRCALFLPVLSVIASQHGPLALLDVGASAGLNLNLDRYGYHWPPHDHLNSGSAVRLDCDVSGAVPIPREMPTIGWRRGLDRSPIDVTDPEQARWLEACIWPEQTGRAANLRAAIRLTSEHPVDVREGDAVTDLPRHLLEAAAAGHPVVTNSWVLNYLATPEREAYVATLDDLGATTDLSWVYAESPAEVRGIPRVTDESRQNATVLSLVRWRDGQRTVVHLADAHPHGRWIDWCPQDG